MTNTDIETMVQKEAERLGVNSPEFMERHKEIMELAAEIEKNNRPKKQVYTAKDLQGLLEVSESKAYQYIRQMNEELSKKGYITVRGKVPVAYVQERFFGVKAGVD
ncbi:hypothetical protein EDD59_112112 [Muricomes intestini]|uniref:Uncharacterized protein n=1 Tax=Muricomes intestini TaxID=1796634 RepID=A0A4R3K6M3_9FIRM|nr:hypothetical protein [Muricomes intestini]TCS78351.1 hypothetical protein EDD59_112112 [Muricomes intestini]